MNIKDFMKKHQSLIALAILVLMITLVFMAFKEMKLKQEISENCGWENEEVFCVCERSQAQELRRIMENGFNVENVTVVE